jgi:hypothetical protein
MNESSIFSYNMCVIVPAVANTMDLVIQKIVVL